VQLWELAARESIRETIARYAQRADRGRFEELAELFTSDGVLAIEGEGPLEGRAAIVDYLTGVGRDLVAAATAVPQLRHHVSSLSITMVSETEANAACYFLAVTEHGVDHWGRYRDRLVPDGDEWLFAHRSVRTDGTIPGGWAAGRLGR
jgi:hypothetical protein